MPLQGKGYFIWRIWACENGDVNVIANLAQQARFSHILIKVADGTYSYNIYNNVDLVPPLIQALKHKGIQCWGWHYLYGDDPVGEANMAIQRISQLGLDGYALDVEGEFEQSGKNVAARNFMNRLRNAYPKLPIALCSFRFPSLHPQVPWSTFLQQCDYNMPQVYWEQAHNPAEQLTRCVQEFQALSPVRPIIPVGAAYRSGSWSASPAEVLEFLLAAQSLNLSAANFWEWVNTRKYLPEVWNTIRDYDWANAPPIGDISEQLIYALNTHDADKVTVLYLTDAVHVNAARTVQGLTAIQAWYNTLLNSLLPNATFIHTGYSGSASTRWFTWRATSNKGNVENGSDTLGLYNGKIAYHYTSFTITPPG